MRCCLGLVLEGAVLLFPQPLFAAVSSATKASKLKTPLQQPLLPDTRCSLQRMHMYAQEQRPWNECPTACPQDVPAPSNPGYATFWQTASRMVYNAWRKSIQQVLLANAY